MSNQMDQAIQSVIDLHILIENVFTGKNAEQRRFKVRVLA